jgi:predicted ATPase
MPQFVDFTLEPQEMNPANILLNWHEAADGYLFRPHQISDGTLRFRPLRRFCSSRWNVRRNTA